MDVLTKGKASDEAGRALLTAAAAKGAGIVCCADYPHDPCRTQGRAEFSDGSSLELQLTGSPPPRYFPPKPHAVTRLIPNDPVKADDPSLFPALTQMKLWSTEA